MKLFELKFQQIDNPISMTAASKIWQKQPWFFQIFPKSPVWALLFWLFCTYCILSFYVAVRVKVEKFLWSSSKIHYQSWLPTLNKAGSHYFALYSKSLDLQKSSKIPPLEQNVILYWKSAALQEKCNYSIKPNFFRMQGNIFFSEKSREQCIEVFGDTVPHWHYYACRVLLICIL